MKSSCDCTNGYNGETIIIIDTAMSIVTINTGKTYLDTGEVKGNNFKIGGLGFLHWYEPLSHKLLHYFNFTPVIPDLGLACTGGRSISNT